MAHDKEEKGGTSTADATGGSDFLDLLRGVSGWEASLPDDDAARAAHVESLIDELLADEDSAEILSQFQDNNGETPIRFGEVLARIRTALREGPEPDWQPGHDIATIEGASGASSILIVGPLGSDAHDVTCCSAFKMVPPEQRDALLISLNRGAKARNAVLIHHKGDQRHRLAHIYRASPKSPDGWSALNESDQSFRTAAITRIDDLPRLGMLIGELLEDWEGAEATLVVCFHSLTALLQHVSEDRLFRFLHVLLGKFEGQEARAHFHLDERTHDDRLVVLLKQLFELSVRVTDTGVEVIE